jgi:VRR-NUC domain
MPRVNRYRRDGNHAAITEALVKCGALVADLSGCSGGIPDILVLYRGRFFLLELKVKNGKLRDSQIEFAKRFPVSVCRSPREALVAIGVEVEGT